MIQAVQQGRVPEDAIDDKVTRLLRLAHRVGDVGSAPGGGADAWLPDEVATELRSTAAASFVLVRNGAARQPTADETGPLLALNPDRLRRVAVIGPNAAAARTLGGEMPWSSRPTPSHRSAV